MSRKILLAIIALSSLTAGPAYAVAGHTAATDCRARGGVWYHGVCYFGA